MYYLSLLGTILSNRKNLMELRQPNPGASLKLHGLLDSEVTLLFPEHSWPTAKDP